MKLVERLFEAFDERVLRPSGIDPAEHAQLWRDMKRAFYGGARGMFDLLSAATEAAVENDWPEEKGGKFMADVDAELAQFGRDVEEGRQ